MGLRTIFSTMMQASSITTVLPLFNCCINMLALVSYLFSTYSKMKSACVRVCVCVCVCVCVRWYNIFIKTLHFLGSSHGGAAEMNLTSIHEDVGSIPGPAPWGPGSGIAMNCGVGHKCSSDPTLLWLWPAFAALILPLAWNLHVPQAQP